MGTADRVPALRGFVNPVAVGLSEQEAPGVGSARLLEAARGYHGRGWRPLPLRITFSGDGQKELDFLGNRWSGVREGPLSWEATEELFRKAGGRANALALVLEPGHVVLDTDSAKAEAVLCDMRLPQGPRARTPRGWHRHFRLDPERAQALDRDKVDLGPGMHLLVGRICVVPPSLDGAYAWDLEPEGKLPALPLLLWEMAELSRAAAPGSAGGRPERRSPARAAPLTAARSPLEELRPWIALVGELRPDGLDRWKAICPLHFETRPSFTVYRGKRAHHLQAECFGCGWKGSLRQLRRALRGADPTLYRQALDAIASYGQGLDAQTRHALLAIVGELQRRGVDPREPFQLSYRELAKLTGCEPLDFPVDGPVGPEGKPEGVLRFRGRAVVRLQERLSGLGVPVRKGTRRRSGGGGGRKTEYTLPPAWFSRLSALRPPQTTEASCLRLTSSSVDSLERKQQQEAEKAEERLLESVRGSFRGATIEEAGEEEA